MAKRAATSKASDRQVGGNHYAKMKIQPGYFCWINDIGGMETVAIRYICRHKSKAGRVDLEKAIHTLQLLLEWEYGDTGRQGEIGGQESPEPP